jgi:transposase
MALDFLPPYSPELNPVERVWKLTRRLCLHTQNARYAARLITHGNGTYRVLFWAWAVTLGGALPMLLLAVGTSG